VDLFTLPTKSNLHFSLSPAETHKLVDILLVAAAADYNVALSDVKPDPAFADALATRLVRQMRAEGMSLS
jgi:hypothetical protein